MAKNHVMGFKQFKSAADSAKKGYAKSANITNKDKGNSKIDQELQDVTVKGKKASEGTLKKNSDSSLHKGFSGDTPVIKKFVSKHLTTIEKKDIVNGK